MTPLKLYNSLTRQLEEFRPAGGFDGLTTSKRVNMFVCGPTVYDYIHLGNARTFTVFDVVAKWLRHSGYEVNYIQNITDIDDKIIKRAAEAGRDPLEYAHQYDDKFRADMKALGNDAVTQYARATDHIPQVIAQVKTLRDKGFAYLIEGDGWYYDLSKFPDYGKLSGRTAQMADDAVSRIDESEKKRNSGDFALWKLSKPGEPVWEDTELGAGRPGWHIEDTAITEHYFGPQYDLHGGGMDLKFPHHEAEIAQQEAASGKVPFVRYWMHSGFLENKSEKMSKSLGNFATLHELLEKYEPAVLRFYLLSNHYRSPLDFTDKALDASQAGVSRIGELLSKLASVAWDEADDSALSAAVDEARHGVDEAMNDDFNTAAAFAAIFELVKEANKAVASQAVSTQSAGSAGTFLKAVSDLFGIVPKKGAELPADIQKLVDDRQNVREHKDFATSDKLRGRLAELGWTVDDTPYGPLIKKK